MARVTEYGNTGNGRSNDENQDSQNTNAEVIAADQSGPLQVPNETFIRDADITREGQDLILESPDGSVIVIEGYFNADPAPMITSPEGATLTPKLVSNFVQENGPLEYARADSVIDESAVGEVLEITGQANVVRADGSIEQLTIGTPIYQGDIIETQDEGAVNIQFIDESTFAVSENARLAIDEYVFDPSTESGSTNFSVLRGIFVFTSGLIGRDDPDDVQIDTPVGSIGIRGTTIMGNVDTGEITVIEGAIVLRSYSGNEMTLDEQFETGRFEPATGEITAMGTKSADDMTTSYDSVSGVMPSLFSSFDSGADNSGDETIDSSQPITVADSGTTAQQTESDGASENTADGETQLAAATQEVVAGETTSEQTADGTKEATATSDGTVTETAATEEEQQTTDTTQTITLADSDPDFGTAAGTGLSGSSTDTTSNSSTTGTSSGTTSSGSTTTTATQPPPLLPLDIEINRKFVEDSIADGQLIAGVRTTADFKDVRFTLNDDLGGMIGLVDGPNNGAAIRLVSGPLVVGTPLNISVTATLPDGRSTTESYTVNVVDENDAPTITNPGATFAIGEDALVGDAVGTVTATDINAGDVLSYSIVSGNAGGAFRIDAAGNIRVNNTLDYESLATSYTLQVRVRDDGFGTLSDTQTFTININDINEAPVINDPAANSFTLSEDVLGGTIVADASTYASDPDGDTLSYTITAGNADGAFSIDASGVITVSSGGILDADTLANRSLTVEVTDAGGLTDTAIFDIGLTNVDDEAATVSTNTGQTVNEGATVTITNAELQTSDVDTANSSLTYTITSAPTNGQIELTTNVGTAVTSFTQADIDAGRVVYVHNGSNTTADSFNFNVTDGTNGTAAGTFNLSVTPVNDLPTLDLDGTAIGAGFNQTFDETGAVAVVNSDVNIADSDDTNMESAVVTLTNAQDGTSEQLFISAADLTTIQNTFGITVTGSGTHSISLSGSSSVANYEQALQFIRYNNIDDTPEETVDRVVDITVNDGDGNSNTAQATIDVIAVDDADTFNGTAANDTITGDAGNDTFVLNASDGSDTFDGAGGTDTYDGSAITAPTNLIFDMATSQISGAGGTDTISNIENFIGGGGNDVFNSNGGAYAFTGGAGDDTYKATNEVIDFTGGTGNDTLEFTAAGNYNFANFTAHDSVEVYETNAGGVVNLSLDLNASMFTSAASGDITFDITSNANNVLDIDFSTYTGGGNWNLTAGDLSGGGTVTFTNDATGETVNINYVGDGSNITPTAAVLDPNPPTLVSSGTHESGISNLTARDTELRLSFDENITKGATGDIRVFNSANTLIETISISDVRAETQGNELYVKLNTLLEANTSYHVEIDNGAIEDLSGNAYGGFSGSTTFNFTTGRETFMTTVGGMGNDQAAAVLEVFDSVSGKSEGYITVGTSARGGNQDIAITKYDHQGFVQDVIMMGNAGNDGAFDIAHNSAGIFVGGTTNDAGSAGSNDFTLTNLGPNGTVNWSNFYGTGANETMSAVNTVNGTTDIVMAGTVHTTDSAGRVIKVNGDGSEAWSVDYSQSLADVSVEDIFSTTQSKYSGDLIMAGNHSANGGDIMISRIDDFDGSLVWSRNIDVSGARESMNDMAQFSDDRFVIAGETDLAGAGNTRGLLVSFSDSSVGGNTPQIDWAVAIGNAGQSEFLTDVIVLNDGSILAIGQMGATSQTGLITKINAADGSIMWARSLDHGTGSVSLKGIEEAADGSLIITGYTTGGTVNGSNDSFTFGMTAAGAIENTAGTLITNAALDANWSIADQTALIGHEVLTIGTQIDMFGNSLTTSSPVITTAATGWTAEDSSDVDHAIDILGATTGTANFVDTGGGLTQNFTGQDGTFSGLGGSDTFTIDGNDVVRMGTGNDEVIFQGSNDGATIYLDELGYIDGGSGGAGDTFSLSTNNDLDLSAIKADSGAGLRNIEILNLADASANAQTVKLSYDAIIGMTDDNNELIINGANNDSVALDLSGHGFVAVDSSGGTQGPGYEYYTNGTVHLYIQDAVDQTNIA